jgi:hypothetical protein
MQVILWYCIGANLLTNTEGVLARVKRCRASFCRANPTSWQEAICWPPGGGAEYCWQDWQEGGGLPQQGGGSPALLAALNRTEECAVQAPPLRAHLGHVLPTWQGGMHRSLSLPL